MSVTREGLQPSFTQITHIMHIDAILMTDCRKSGVRVITRLTAQACEATALSGPIFPTLPHLLAEGYISVR